MPFSLRNQNAETHSASNSCALDTIHRFSVTHCSIGCLQEEIAIGNQWNFGKLGLLEYWLYNHTIPPKIVLFDVKVDLLQSRRCLTIINAENTFQRQHVFLDSNDKQQESVRNRSICTQFKINLCSMLGLLEYLFIWWNMQCGLMFRIYYLCLVSLICICIISVEVWTQLVHTSLCWRLCMIISNEKSNDDVQGYLNKTKKNNNAWNQWKVTTKPFFLLTCMCTCLLCVNIE